MNSQTLWYYHADGRGFGPIQETDIRELFKRGEVAASTLVWREGLNDWTEAYSTELGAPAPIPARRQQLPSISDTGPGRRKHGKAFWVAFALAEMFNFLIFGLAPLLGALALSL